MRHQLVIASICAASFVAATLAQANVDAPYGLGFPLVAPWADAHGTPAFGNAWYAGRCLEGQSDYFCAFQELRYFR